jgi:hypothetical protein
MKKLIRYVSVCLLVISLFTIQSCSKKADFSAPNSLLKKVIFNGYTTSEYTYNNDNMIAEVNSTTLYRKFYYDSANRLVKEELAMNPNMLSSSMPDASMHDFVDPGKTGITMTLFFKYGSTGNLSKQLAYVYSENGKFEFRSMRTYEYNNSNLVSKILLHDSDSTVTQFITYQYDDKGNVSEENGYSYLFIPSGSEPSHLYKATFEYDNYFNPFMIFSNTGIPGINSNINNIIKMVSISYQDTPGLINPTQSDFTYKYDSDLHYPVKSSDGSEFVYDK